MRRPVVVLHVDGAVPESVHLLVRSLASRCTFRSEARLPAAALVVGGATPAAAVPVALWCSSAQDATSPLAARAVALLHDGALDERGALHQPAALRVSAPVPGLSTTPVATAVRARLRRARGMSEAPVLLEEADGWRWQGRPVADDLVPTAMACAAAVVATEPAQVLLALSWGAPVVTTAAAATAVGATDGVEVLVCPDARTRRAAALALAGDEREAARLGRAGRLLVERRYDLDATLAQLALLLRLDVQGQPLGLSETLLDSLSTPRDAAVRSRVALALGPLRQPRPEAPVLPDALSATRTEALEPAATSAPMDPAAAGPRAALTARRVAKAVLRRAVSIGAAHLVAELRENRAEVARLQAEVSELRAASAGAASPDALAAELELLKAEVAGLAASLVRAQQER